MLPSADGLWTSWGKVPEEGETFTYDNLTTSRLQRWISAGQWKFMWR